jgi:hypothetical protein
MNIGKNLPPRDQRDAKLWDLLPAIDAPYDNHRLSSAETEALVEALADGFGEVLVQGTKSFPLPTNVKGGLLKHAFFPRPDPEYDADEWDDVFWRRGEEDEPSPSETFPLGFIKGRLQVYFRNQFNRYCVHENARQFEKAIDFSIDERNRWIFKDLACRRLYEKPWYEFHALQYLYFIEASIKQCLNLKIPGRGFISIECFGGQLGRLVEQYYWRFRYESAVISAEGARKGASAGGKAKAERDQIKHSMWKKEASKIWANRPDLSKNAVADIVRKQLDEAVTARHISRYIAHP